MYATRGDPTRRLRVLLVDDEPILVRLGLIVLTRAGYDAVCVDRPEEALTRATVGEPFDLLITDVRMPHISGLELAARLRELQPELAVLYVSGWSTDPIDQAGRTSFLHKPFKVNELLDHVGMLLQPESTAVPV